MRDFFLSYTCLVIDKASEFRGITTDLPKDVIVSLLCYNTLYLLPWAAILPE